jgi:hypothetical protein
MADRGHETAQDTNERRKNELWYKATFLTRAQSKVRGLDVDSWSVFFPLNQKYDPPSPSEMEAHLRKSVKKALPFPSA